MKIFLKQLAFAAALGLAPAAALAQGAAQPAPAPAAANALPAQPTQALPAPPSDAISAASQANPAQPQESSDPAITAADAAAPAATAPLPLQDRAAPVPSIGQPDGRMGLQDQFTGIGEEAAWFHNAILIPVIAAISIFVLGLLLYVVVRYRRAAHPTPSRTTHNTLIEVIWTVIPVIVLVIIAVPSIRLLANQYDPPKADLTVKVIGNQWYWSYQYPDNGDFELVSNMLSDADAKKRGEPRLLAVDERMVVPAGAVVKLIVTSNDVIHAFAVPAFWSKMDAVPGRLNETWFKVDRPGVYYGQCSELCGARHAYMPIAVEVVPPAQFAAWVASKGGTMPGQVAPTSSDSTQASPLENPTTDLPAATPAAAPETTPPAAVTPGVATPPTSAQGATNAQEN